jgi:hypothetical protein
MQPTFFGHAKSIAGPALIGFGILILHEKLDGAAAQLNHLLGKIPGNALGVLPTFILAASRVLRAYAADHQQFLRDFLQHLLISSWPLLLVVIGTILSQDGFRDKAEVLPKKDRGLVDPAAGRSTLD